MSNKKQQDMLTAFSTEHHHTWHHVPEAKNSMCEDVVPAVTFIPLMPTHVADLHKVGFGSKMPSLR